MISRQRPFHLWVVFFLHNSETKASFGPIKFPVLALNPISGRSAEFFLKLPTRSMNLIKGENVQDAPTLLESGNLLSQV